MKNYDLPGRKIFPENGLRKIFLKFSILCTICMVMCFPLLARDVNLDKIYLKKGTGYLSKIVDAKMELYQNIGASLLGKDVIFADWTSGKRIVYIRENLKYNVNFISAYYPESRSRNRIAECRLLDQTPAHDSLRRQHTEPGRLCSHSQAEKL